MPDNEDKKISAAPAADRAATKTVDKPTKNADDYKRERKEAEASPEHKMPHSRVSKDGKSEIVGPMTIETFKETPYYKQRSDEEKKMIDMHLKALSKGEQDVRIAVQNSIEGDKTTHARIHMGQLSYDGFGPVLHVDRSMNLANGKSSSPEERLELGLRGKGALPTQADVDKFIKTVTERETKHELAVGEPAKDEASLAAALAKGHSGAHQYEGAQSVPMGIAIEKFRTV